MISMRMIALVVCWICTVTDAAALCIPDPEIHVCVAFVPRDDITAFELSTRPASGFHLKACWNKVQVGMKRHFETRDWTPRNFGRCPGYWAQCESSLDDACDRESR